MADDDSAVAAGRDWDLIIRPRRNWLVLKLGEFWRYRDLVMLFVRRGFVSLYKQTILGPLWHQSRNA